MDMSTSVFNTTWLLSTTGQLVKAEREMWSATYRARNLLIGLTGVVLNVLTLVAVMHHKDLTRFLRCALASLVSTDLGLLATIFVASLSYQTPDPITLSMSILVYVFTDCTAMTLLVIALDRACAVYFPVWYKSMSGRYMKILLLVLSPWVLAVCFSVVSFKEDIEDLPRYPISLLKESGVLLQAVLLLTCGSGVLLAYVGIGLRLRLKARRFLVHPSFLASAATNHPTPAEYQVCRRITIHTAFLAAWFCIIYISFSCYLLTIYLTQADTLAEFNSARNIFMSSIILINSVVNPFLFFWKLITFTSALNFIRRLVRKTEQSVPPHTQETQNVEMVSTVDRVVSAGGERQSARDTHTSVGLF